MLTAYLTVFARRAIVIGDRGITAGRRRPNATSRRPGQDASRRVRIALIGLFSGDRPVQRLVFDLFGHRTETGQEQTVGIDIQFATGCPDHPFRTVHGSTIGGCSNIAVYLFSIAKSATNLLHVDRVHSISLTGPNNCSMTNLPFTRIALAHITTIEVFGCPSI